MKSSALLIFLFLVVGCNAAPSSTPVSTQPATPIPVTETVTLPATSLPTTLTAPPLPENEAQPPIELQIPALHVTVPVLPMTWQVVTVNGERQSEWQIPLDAAGWHPNSAMPGSRGTLILSGHQRLGSAVFASIAQGGVQQGMEILVKDALARSWHYRVVTVSQPIPVTGATAEEQAQFDSYLVAGDAPRLVLLTGWPEFSDTHYLAVVAELY